MLGHPDLRLGGWLHARVGDCGGAVAVALARGIGGVLTEPVMVGHVPRGNRRRPTVTTTGAMPEPAAAVSSDLDMWQYCVPCRLVAGGW